MTRLFNFCPSCGERLPAHAGALSRKDNTTEICPQCGVDEAMEDFAMAELSAQSLRTSRRESDRLR